MSRFKVTIGTGERGGYGHFRQTYEIHNRSHDDTAIRAAEEALKTFRNHGHTRFPHNDGPISLTVEEIEEEDANR